MTKDDTLLYHQSSSSPSTNHENKLIVKILSIDLNNRNNSSSDVKLAVSLTNNNSKKRNISTSNKVPSKFVFDWLEESGVNDDNVVDVAVLKSNTKQVIGATRIRLVEELFQNNGESCWHVLRKHTDSDDEVTVKLEDMGRIKISINRCCSMTSSTESAFPIICSSTDTGNASNKNNDSNNNSLTKKNQEGDRQSRHFYSSNVVVPRIYLKEGRNAKASITSPRAWVTTSLTLDGRDKITKVFQYSARFLAWYFDSRIGIKELTTPLRALQNHLTVSRKAFRIGRWVTEWYKIVDLWSKGNNNNSKSIYKIALTFRLVGLMGFWANDNIIYLVSAGFLKSSPRVKSSAQKLGAKFYFMSCWMALFLGLSDYRAHQVKLRNLEEKQHQQLQEEYEKAKVENFRIVLTIVKAISDILVFSNNTGIDLHERFRGKKMNEGLHSLLGIVSASTVLYNKFPTA